MGELNQVVQVAQVEVAAAQAATAVAQVEAVADRVDAVRARTTLAGTVANADRTCDTQWVEILRLTTQLEVARGYICPEFAADAEAYIREQAQEAVDFVTNARKEWELQEAVACENDL